MLIKKKKEYMLAIGSISLVIAIALDRFAGAGTVVDFFCGLFTGLSLTMNLAYLIRFRYEKNSNLNQKQKKKKGVD